MKVGLLARAEDRGLGIQSWEFHRHLHPDRTLVVTDPRSASMGFPAHLDRYPGATVVPWVDGQLDERTVRGWLDGLDVVFAAETLYDWRLADWARAAGCGTVVQVNPEFYRHHVDPLPAPTAWWAPSPWRIDLLHPTTRLVPVPVATDRWPTPVAAAPGDGPLRVLHVVGHKAAGDRNGTLQLLQALRMMRQRVHVTVVAQDARTPRIRGLRHVTLSTVVGGLTDYWDLYAGHHLLVLPRRYGGLCLPAQEAMGAGLGVVMSDTEPNGWWPAELVTALNRGTLQLAGGRIDMAATKPVALARLLDALAADPARVQDLQGAGRRWARGHSWVALGPQYRDQLTEIAGVAKSCQAEM